MRPIPIRKPTQENNPKSFFTGKAKKVMFWQGTHCTARFENQELEFCVPGTRKRFHFAQMLGNEGIPAVKKFSYP